MRTLTLGVLIVTGGTFAALPFRRYQAIPDASSVPSQVSGPTRSALDTSRDDTGGTAAKVAQHSVGSEPGAVPAAADALAALPQWPQSSPPPRERKIDIPLTFEDLEMPIDPPAVIAEKFAATAPIRQRELAHEKIAGLEMPRLEALAESQREELRKVAQSATTLASTTSRESQPQPLPGTKPIERDRHWIRQPE